MGGHVIIIGLLAAAVAMAYMPAEYMPEKDSYLADAFLRNMVERMGNELTGQNSAYIDLPAIDRRFAMMTRGKDLENEQLDYDSLLDGNPSPRIRDQEYLQHSSLWGRLDVQGGAGEGEQRLQPSGAIPNRPLTKTDAILPAYCNPPNPCPEGYTEEQGCLTEFENTAAFSREYQATQHCMCDAEHMFNCPETAIVQMHSDHFKNLVAKKYFAENENPYLNGERLPIAAKKGF